jgi:hypothetical protein
MTARRRAEIARMAAAALALLLPATQLWSATPAPTRSALYPAPRGHLRFEHAAHKQAPCATCHAGVSASTRAADQHSPGMDACATCHTGEPGQAPAMERCGACHVGSKAVASGPVVTPAQWRAISPAPLITPAPRSSAIRFSHAAHAASACATCHGDPGAAAMPAMAQCTSCHTGTPQDARPSSACATCHTGELARQGAAPVATVGGKRLMPGDHSVDWLKRHGPMSRAAGDTCNACHTPPSCASCHGSQQAGAYQVHPPNFIALHNAAARGDMANCTDCHKVETFCAGCHARTRNLPDSPLSPPPRVAYHPPGWLDNKASGNHGVMARRNITDCASCHQERDCVSCHQGISPHPAGFAMECKRWLEANPAPCAQCHTSQDALRMLCR